MKNMLCTKCKIKKVLDEFYSDKRYKNRKNPQCKKCKNQASKKYYEKYPWRRILINIKYRCNNPKCKDFKYYGGRGIKCEITEKQVKFLWFRDIAYDLIIPNIDRENNDGNYCLENCRFIEKSLNVAERNVRVSSKEVNQYDLQGNFIRSWKSIHEIERILGFYNSNISYCCSGKYKQAYGYK